MEDEEGFEYPVIDQEICIKCLQCIKVCPLKKEFNKVLWERSIKVDYEIKKVVTIGKNCCYLFMY